MMLDVKDPVVEFTTASRCDRCSAQAHAQAAKDTAMSELLFCIHHLRDHYKVMVDEGWEFTFSEEAYEMLDSRPLAMVE